MRTGRILQITGSVGISAAVFAVLYLSALGVSPYHEGVGLIRYSDYEFQKAADAAEGLEHLEIKHLSDDALREAPIVRDLIEQSLAEDFPLSPEGRVSATYDDMFANHRYVAQKHVAKYGGNVDDYFTISEPDPDTKSMYPGSYEYRTDSKFFRHDGTFYVFSDEYVLVGGPDPPFVGIYMLQRAQSQFVDLTDADLAQLPTVQSAINATGMIQENIDVSVALSRSDINQIDRWREKYDLSWIFEYDKNYYSITRWTA